MLLLNKLSCLVGGGRNLYDISVVGTNTSSASTITCPAETQAGDFIALYQKSYGPVSAPSAVTPANFTNEYSITGSTNLRVMIDLKIATGGEGGSSITGMNGGSGNLKGIIVFRGNIPFTGYVTNSENSQATLNNPTAQVCTASAATSPCIVIGSYFGDSGNTISPRTFTGATPTELGVSVAFYVNYKIFNNNPADITIDMDDEGYNYLHSCYYTFTT